MALPENINTLEKSKFVEYNGEVCVRTFVVNSSSGTNFVKNFGRENILDGQDYLTIVFDNPMSNQLYTTLVSIETYDLDPIFVNHMIKGKLTTGMIVKLNAPVDSANYFINWAVLE